jgi:hypothetical protein
MRIMLLASAAASLLTGLAAVREASAEPSSGSYQTNCQHPRIVNGVLSAECLDKDRRLRLSSLLYHKCNGDIRNENGLLACNGAIASGGTLVQSDNGKRPPPSVKGSVSLKK